MTSCDLLFVLDRIDLALESMVLLACLQVLGLVFLILRRKK